MESSDDDLRRRIEDLRRERGFLLPHHGAMAVSAPDLLDAYFGMYRALTLTARSLDPLEKEIVWLAVLIALKAEIGTHHIDLFRRAGGSDAQAGAAAMIAAFALGSEASAFLDGPWRTRFPGLDARASYRAAFDRLTGEELPSDAAPLALAAASAALGRLWSLSAAIQTVYDCKISEDKLAEALSLVMWPAGVNKFVDACGLWRDMMASGAVTPSERFKIWAETPRQGGFDER